MNHGYRSGTVALLATGGIRMNWEVVNNRQFSERCLASVQNAGSSQIGCLASRSNSIHVPAFVVRICLQGQSRPPV